MERKEVEEIVRKVFRQDYERWLAYVDECIKDRSSYTRSFYSWKEKYGMMEKDIETLALILSD